MLRVLCALSSYAWFDNVNYDYDYFLIASGTSVLGMAIWRASSWVVFRLTGWEGPGVSALFTRVPGYGFITGERPGARLGEGGGAGGQGKTGVGASAAGRQGCLRGVWTWPEINVARVVCWAAPARRRRWGARRQTLGVLSARMAVQGGPRLLTRSPPWLPCGSGLR